MDGCIFIRRNIEKPIVTGLTGNGPDAHKSVQKWGSYEDYSSEGDKGCTLFKALWS